MNLLTTLNRERQGEGGNAPLLFFYRLFLLITLLAPLFSCGIPSPVYLAPPERISAPDPSFRHADQNNPAIFRGYEIFYLFYDPSNLPFSDFSNDNDDWKNYAQDYITSSLIAYSGSDLMNYKNTSEPYFRRVYAGLEDTSTPVHFNFTTMIPTDPSSVSFSGTGLTTFDLTRTGVNLSLNSTTTFLAKPSEAAISLYDLNSLDLLRIVRDGGLQEETVQFFDLMLSHDDIPSISETADLNVVFFAVTSGFDSTYGIRILSELEYIGIIDYY